MCSVSTGRLLSKAGTECREEFLYILKAGPAGGRLRRPSSAGNPTATGAGRLNASALRRSARRATEYPVDNDAGLLMESAT
jgi:hypothetical protein